MHSLIDNCCETHFYLLCMVLPLIGINTAELFIFFLLHMEYKIALNTVRN